MWNIEFLPLDLLVFTDVDGNVPQEQGKFWFKGCANSRYSPLSHYKFSVSITIFLPILGASDFPPALFAYNMLSIYTQSPVNVCVCALFVFSSGLGVNASMFGCIGPCGHACFSAIFWVVKQEGEPDHVPWWRALTMSILLPEICLTGTAGRGSQACVASPPPASSGLVKTRRRTPLTMDSWALGASPRFEMQPNMVSVWEFQTTILPLFQGVYSNEHRLFCVTAPKKTRVVIKERLTLTNSMFGWTPMQSSPRREHQSNESFLLSSSLPWILYLVKHLLTRRCAQFTAVCCALIRNLPNSVTSSKDCQHKKDSHDCT